MIQVCEINTQFLTRQVYKNFKNSKQCSCKQGCFISKQDSNLQRQNSKIDQEDVRYDLSGVKEKRRQFSLF